MGEQTEKGSNNPQKSTVDKIIMGAIIGTAIGSAVGLTMAPKKGKETREDVKKLSKETATGFLQLGRLVLGKLFGKKVKKEDHPRGPMKELPNEMEIMPPSSNKNDV